MNNLTVVIPSRTATNLVPCVEAILEHEPRSTRIVVVDDGVDWSFLPKPWASLSEIKGTKPFVYARNCNLGIVAAGKDDVILLNDDALLGTSGGFTAMQRAAEENPEYGVVGAVTNVVGNQDQFRTGTSCCLGREASRTVRSTPRMVCFVCVLIPRRTIDRVGLLDEEFTGYGFEDDSYCLRVRRAGLKIGIFDGCFVDHGSLRSTFRGDPRTPADLRENAAIFKRKYGAEHWAL